MNRIVRLLVQIFQFLFDAFFQTRKAFVWLLTFLSLRLCGVEIGAKDVWHGSYSTTVHKDLNLDKAGDLPRFLDTVKVCLTTAQDRRAVVSDKCRTLLTVSSVLLTLIALLLPKFIHLDDAWMAVTFYIAMSALLNTIILLLVFFDVGVDMDISLDSDDVALDAKDMQKNLINLHRQCQATLDNRTNYLVDLYKAARFFFLSAFALVVLLFAVSSAVRSHVDLTEEIIMRLRADTAMINLLRGPKGEKGNKGDQGDRGVRGERGDRGPQPRLDLDALVARLLKDPRFWTKLEIQTSPPLAAASRIDFFPNTFFSSRPRTCRAALRSARLSRCASETRRGP
ncbi:MAG: collagen-like protein [Planctomycetes bacterium]|nr:collagen-like protein [Planctomycetota bacterium]